MTVLNISDTQLCFTSPWLSDSTHFISITTLLISFPLLCHSLPSHRLSTPFHRFTSHFNSAAFLRHPLTPLLFAIPIQNYSKTQRRYTLTSHTNAYTQLRFDFHCPLFSALCFSGAPHICSVSYHNSATPVRFCALLLRNYTKQFIARAPLCFANTLHDNAIPKHHSLFFSSAGAFQFNSFALRTMLFNARTDQYLRLTTQCLNCTNPTHHVAFP